MVRSRKTGDGVEVVPAFLAPREFRRGDGWRDARRATHGEDHETAAQQEAARAVRDVVPQRTEHTGPALNNRCFGDHGHGVHSRGALALTNIGACGAYGAGNSIKGSRTSARPPSRPHTSPPAGSHRNAFASFRLRMAMASDHPSDHTRAPVNNSSSPSRYSGRNRHALCSRRERSRSELPPFAGHLQCGVSGLGLTWCVGLQT
jgi:hypothetical protein